ncbi:hypothetical protein LINPERPRIM_LOCUS10313, partial [Linum perenne]
YSNEEEEEEEEEERDKMALLKWSLEFQVCSMIFQKFTYARHLI